MSAEKPTPKEHWTNLLKEAVDTAYPIDRSKPPMVQTMMRSRQPLNLANSITTNLSYEETLAGSTATTVTAADVKAWLAGTALPKPAQYEAMVAILSSSQPEEAPDDWETRFVDAYKNAQIAARAEKDFPAGARSATSRTPRPSINLGSGTRGVEERTPPLTHTDGRALPEHQGCEDYEELPRARLAGINRDTQNATEYLITHRLLQYRTRTDVAGKCGKDRSLIYSIEVSGALPNPETVSLLKAHYFNDVEGEYFERLVNQNHRAIMARAWEKGEYKKFGNHLQHVDDALLHQELAAFLHGGKDTLIQTRGNYALFLRRCLGEHNFASAAKTLGTTPSVVQIYENHGTRAEKFSTADAGAVANYIAKLETAFAAKEIADGVPENERLASLFAQERWKQLAIIAPQKSNADAVMARRGAGGDGLPSH
jgi:hypothetical protein